MVSTHLKNIGQNGNLPQLGVKIKKDLKPPPRKVFFCGNDNVFFYTIFLGGGLQAGNFPPIAFQGPRFVTRFFRILQCWGNCMIIKPHKSYSNHNMSPNEKKETPV